jgi:hypothetical protein
MEEQNVVYDNNNNNTQTPLDDELDSVLEQISQVHKLVNSTNQQFNVLQTKLNEADKLKLGKKKLKKRRVVFDGIIYTIILILTSYFIFIFS